MCEIALIFISKLLLVALRVKLWSVVLLVEIVGAITGIVQLAAVDVVGVKVVPIDIVYIDVVAVDIVEIRAIDVPVVVVIAVNEGIRI